MTKTVTETENKKGLGMKRMEYMTVAPKAMDQIKKGAFLTVKSGDYKYTVKG